MVVYKILNLITNQSYIGQTVRTLKERWNEHCKSNEPYYMSRVIQKYGKENFHVEEIAWCETIDELNYYEKYYIKLFNLLSPGGYNLDSGGLNSLHCEETKQKMRGKNNPMYGKDALANKSEQERLEINLRRSESMLGKNKGKNPFSNKSLEELNEFRRRNLEAQNRPEVRKKKSDLMKIISNKPERKKLQQEIGKRTSHFYWHKRRNLINLNCIFCIEIIN